MKALVIRAKLIEYKPQFSYLSEKYVKVTEEERQLEEGTVAEAKYYYKSYSGGESTANFEEELTVVINIEEVDEDYMEHVEKFTKKLEENLEEGVMFGDAVDAFNKLLDLFTDIKLPYSIPSMEVKMSQVGGDYPEGEIEIVYRA